MAAQPLGRARKRRLTRIYGVPILWATTSGALTTPDHRHPMWGPGVEDYVTGEVSPDVVRRWVHAWERPRCTASCRILFGVDALGQRSNLMRGVCEECDAGAGELHTGECPILLWCLEHVDPDFWPRPVHRPAWVDKVEGGRARALEVDPALIRGGPEIECPYVPPVGGYGALSG